MLSQRIIKCICLVLILLSTNQEGAMSQSAVTEKRTVISSSSSNVDDALADNEYEPSSGSRASNIMSRSIATPLPLSTAGGSSIARTSTGGEQDTKENERFTNYVEKVRFLEAQNKKLATEIEYLGTSWGKEINHIKQIYEAELAEVRKLTDDLSRDKAALEVNRSSIQEQIGDLNRQLDEARGYHQKDQDQINKLNQQLTEYETNISRSRRTIKSLETERARDKATINRQQQEMEKLRIDLDNETLTRLHAEHRRQTLEEDMEFVRRVHKQELNKLIAIAYRDTTAENREFWKNELAQAIREIQEEYDNNENPTQR